MAKSRNVSPFTDKVIRLIKAIPRGRVATYGQIAAYAGSPQGARQVVRILNVYGEKENLPWQRVINRRGTISLPKGGGYESQKKLLKKEGVNFERDDQVDLGRYLWHPAKLDKYLKG